MKTIIYILTLINVFLILLLIDKTDSLNSLNARILKMTDVYKDKNQEFYYSKQHYTYSLIENGKQIDKQVQFRSSEDTVLLTNIIPNDTTLLVMYIPSCDCYSSLYDILYEIEKLDNSKVKVFYYTSHVENSTVDELEEDYNINIFNIGEEYLGLLAEREQKYFIFRLDKDLIAQDFHLLGEEYEQLTRKYIKYLINYSH